MKIFNGKFLLVAALLALDVAPMVSVGAQADTVNLVLWHAKQDAEGDALLALIDAFQAANPNITVEQVYNPSWHAATTALSRRRARAKVPT